MLREAAPRGSGIDEASLAERTRREDVGGELPQAVSQPRSFRRDKLGFVTPEAAWLRNGLGELAADVFASRSFRERGFVDAAAARRRLAKHRVGELDAGFELWRSLNVEL